MKKKLIIVFVSILILTSLVACEENKKAVELKEDLSTEVISAEDFKQNFKKEGEEEVDTLFFEDNFISVENSKQAVYHSVYKRTYGDEIEVEFNGYYLDENFTEPIYVHSNFNKLKETNFEYLPVVMTFLTDDYGPYIHHSFHISAETDKLDKNTKEAFKALGFKEEDTNFRKSETIALFDSDEKNN